MDPEDPHESDSPCRRTHKTVCRLSPVDPHAPGKARPDWMGTSLRTREIIRKQRFHWPAEKVSARSKRWGIHREDP